MLVGDAVHARPPTVAQGAAIVLEDTSVLAQLVLGAPVDDAALAAFAQRRMPRASAVVEGSMQIVDWRAARERGDAPGLLGRTSAMLAALP